ncbi:MAG: YebC/PmpR family DNA-binding transcriptional regulator [Deltaproteobacteria bacterium]|nr:YebC/PmpR family DNA-binding transcriptional regulator [Deltaproteobacteria bacterium]
MGAQWKHAGRIGNAQARGKIMSKIAKDLIVAAKSGADPTHNSKLRIAIEAARKASMTRDTMERAIKKGAGLLDEKVVYETAVYEGFCPHQVPVIIECLTDNKVRTAANVRSLFHKKGQLGVSGSVSWDFKHEGMIEASPPEGAGADPEAAAIEAGAQDLEAGEEGQTRFFTEPSDLDAVSKALTAAKWSITSAKLGWRAKNPLTLDEAARKEVEDFLATIDEDDDVQHLYVGLA